MKNLKKRICIALALCICFGLSACGGKEAAPVETKAKTKTVQLTLDNMYNYFYISKEETNEECKKVREGTPTLGDYYQYSFDYSFEINKRVECKIANVSIKFRIYTFKEQNYWPNYNETVTIFAPADGHASKVVSGFKSEEIPELVKSMYASNCISCEIVSISGTVEIEE